MVTNREIGRLFSLFAELLLLHNKNERLARFLSGASYSLRRISDNVIFLTTQQLSKLFRPEIRRLIEELKKTGTLAELDELIQLTPPGLFEMMRIRGLGGKKLSILWKTAKIDTIEGLLDACKKNKLSRIPGFGLKTEQNIIDAIEEYSSHKTRFHYASVADDADELVHALIKSCNTKQISLCGEVRRKATTVEKIEIIAAIGRKKLSASALRRFMIIQSSTNGQTKAHTLDEIPVTIYHTSKDKFYYELFERTGNESHIKKVISKIKSKSIYSSEEEIYKTAKTPYILPEMREDVAEWDFMKKGGELVTLEDIKGVVHNHTTWSDGVDGMENFVKACKKCGYEYVVISEHSKNAHYAGGVKEEKVLRQLIEIDQLNKKLAGIRIFKSIECDILVSGELDFEPGLLKKFDMVIVSIHQLLKMDEDRATKRIIKPVKIHKTIFLGNIR